jgi:hypothetical protein
MTTLAPPDRGPWWRTVGYLAKRATLAEIGGYRSIYRFLLRRPRVPAGAVGFAYHQPVFAILVVFIVVSAVELVAVDLIVRRWPVVRIALLVLSLWGLVWMFGLLFGMLTRPHAVGPDGLRLRYGSEIDIAVPWDEVHVVSRRSRTRPEKEPQVVVDERGEATLHLRVGDETNIEIRLEGPREVRLPQGRRTVSRITLHVDDPRAFMDEVRRHIG